MTLNKRQILSTFTTQIQAPTKDFTMHTQIDIEVSLVKDDISNINYIRGSYAGRKDRTDVYFETEIPSYIFNFLRDQRKGYFTKTILDEFNSPENPFRQKVYFSTLPALYEYFTELSLSCTILNDLENNNRVMKKVILLKFSSLTEGMRDEYNHADMNKKVTMKFNYFVALEHETHDRLNEKKVIEYYGLKYVDFNHVYRKSRLRLPLLRDTNFSEYTIISWTQEREDYLHKLETALIEINAKLNAFVTSINEQNIDDRMKQLTMNKLLQLEDKQ